MSDFDQNSLQPRNNAGGAVWSLAAFSVAIFFCSVLGAKFLSRMVENDALPRIAYERSMRAVAANARQPSQSYSIVRSIGVDGTTTATIPLGGAAPVSPCGDEKAGK